VTSSAAVRPTLHMKQFAKIRLAATLGIALTAQASAQTTQPTPAAQQQQHRAEVTYTAGQLFVSANNSSLNQILRDIAHATGMKLTGAVADERVFGQYGPAAPSKILRTLLDGTGSNMLLLEATRATPAELILTPRRGGPTPPNPNAAIREEEPLPPPARPEYPPAPAPEETAPGNPQAAQPAVPESSNSVKTPQQIFEQLQRIRQQQQQQPQPARQ
jgi:hypothetical protein